MRTFYALRLHRKDGSSHRHIMQGELPKVADTIPATLAGERVSAKVGVVRDPARNLRDRREGREIVVAVHADEV